MKNSVIIFCICLVCLSCEDVVDVDLENEAPRVVIEVTGIQNQNNEWGIVYGKVSKTNSYYDERVHYLSNAEMYIEVNNTFYKIGKSQNYANIYEDTIPMLYDKDYTLLVNFEGEQYKATTKLYKSVPFNRIEQSNNTLAENQIAINAYFTDPADEENYYYFEFKSKRFGRKVDNIGDELFNGNEVSTFYAEEFKPGDTVSVFIHGISRRYNNFISLALSQATTTNNPFAPAPVSIRGNVINTENPDKFAFGYFRMSQQYDTIYRIE